MYVLYTHFLLIMYIHNITSPTVIALLKLYVYIIFVTNNNYILLLLVWTERKGYILQKNRPMYLLAVMYIHVHKLHC